ncbi:hypothetical protein [Thermomonas sp. LB-4]|uniref:hypothetical protein n=1 Tax=Thermomonas sp. LB-4 TaxID=3102790 RepID=UPI002ED924BD
MSRIATAIPRFKSAMASGMSPISGTILFREYAGWKLPPIVGNSASNYRCLMPVNISGQSAAEYSYIPQGGFPP